MTSVDGISRTPALDHHINCRGAAIEVHHEDRCVVLTGTGEIDAANAHTFSTALSRFGTGPRHVVIDLRPMSFFGTAGLRELLCFDDKCSQSGTRWILLAGPMVQRLIDIACPSHTLLIAATRREADRALQPWLAAETG